MSIASANNSPPASGVPIQVGQNIRCVRYTASAETTELKRTLLCGFKK